MSGTSHDEEMTSTEQETVLSCDLGKIAIIRRQNEKA